MIWIAAVLATAVLNLVVADIAGWLPWLAERIIHNAVRLLPEGDQSRYREEWLAELDVLPGHGISAVVFASRLRLRAHDARRELLSSHSADTALGEPSPNSNAFDTAFHLACMVASREGATADHPVRVGRYSAILARRYGLSESHTELVQMASLLHDVGKCGISDEILRKPGSLTARERETIMGHAEVGYRMLAPSPSETVRLGALIARNHHERWDGEGFPRGLSGDDILLEARIVALADVFDALTSDRVYRSALSPRTAIRIMCEQRGRHFDPALMDTFLEALPEVELIRQS